MLVRWDPLLVRRRLNYVSDRSSSPSSFRMCRVSSGSHRYAHQISVGGYLHRIRLRRLVRRVFLAPGRHDTDPLARVMRKTGKLYTLTLVSCAMTIVATSMVAMWGDDTSEFHLWLDIVPQGLGMASVITTTLIVSPHPLRCGTLLTLVAGYDCQCGQGGPRGGDRKCVLPCRMLSTRL